SSASTSRGFWSATTARSPARRGRPGSIALPSIDSCGNTVCASGVDYTGAVKVCLVCGQQFGLDADVCPRDGSQLDVLTRDVKAPPGRAESAPPESAPQADPDRDGDASLIGESVGGYRIEGLLGRGGMGAVYFAVHSLLGKRAAVKVILGDASHDEARRRFLD